MIALFVFPFIALATFGWYYYSQYQRINAMTPDQFSQRDNDKIIGKIGDLYTLPQDEEPEIAVVKDVEALKNNPFFEPAQNGDYVVVYSGAKLAIIYRPEGNRLVKVGPLNVQDPVKISVIGVQQGRDTVVGTLKALNLSAVDAGDAKGSYTGTSVVDVSGDNATLATQVAAALGAKVTTLPSDEDVSEDTGVLVIVGTNSGVAESLETPTE